MIVRLSTVGGVAGAARIRLEVPLQRVASTDELEAIRSLLAATPYRLPGGTVTVRAGDVLTIELETWANRDRSAIGRRLSARIAAMLAAPPAPSPAVEAEVSA